jgi:hypothetical protein
MEGKPLYLEAEIKLHKETAARKEKASKIIELPPEHAKQPDLLYFSAIFVSSGENLNHAHFMGSELVAAEGTIVNKALDVEHSEEDIVGHIYERAFMSKDGEPLDIRELASKETASLDNEEMHIAIAGIIYKTRFPNIAKEVADNGWKVSMECYYQSYDVKIGDLILDPKEAEALGLAVSDDKLLGRMAKVLKNGKAIAEGAISRVLRGICFSGCGIVKNPANPPSVIMETANEKETEELEDDSVIILDYDNVKQEQSNNLTSDKVDDTVITEEARNGLMDDQEGICVHYKRRVEDKHGKILNNDWCAAFHATCTAFGRSTSDPDCLRNQNIRRFANVAIKRRMAKIASLDKRKELLNGLKAALCEAVKTQSR